MFSLPPAPPIMLRRRAGYVAAVMLLSALFAGGNRFAHADDSEATRGEQTPPNIVLILTDDQGWGDLSIHGNTNLSTPHIDSLAKEGARFDRFYVCPVCSPTRAEILTGRYHPRGGVFSTSAGGERLDLDETTIGDVFTENGYKTGAFGKWHNGMQPPYHPNARGFQEYYGFCSGHWGNYYSPPLEHNGQLVQGNGFIIDDLTDHAIEFIRENRSQPFFAYLPYNTPHSPMMVPERFYAKFRDADIAMHHRDRKSEDMPHLRAALAMCENIDWNVGRVLKTLDDLNIAENTIVLYLSDNGPNGWRWNGDMKGRKGSTDEGGVRSPLLVRWPNRIKPGTVIPEIAAGIDLLPTVIDACDLSTIPEQKPFDGVSLMPLLTRSFEETWPERMIFSHWNNKVSVRTQEYRLDYQGKLYHIPSDPGQRTDLSQKKPEVHERLTLAVGTWKQEVLSELDRKADRPFPIGAADFDFTQLPARDGIARGTIRRSNRFPNCTFFTNWTRTEDRITFDVDVLTAGTYDVTLHYTLRPKDVGTTLRLSLGDASVTKTLTEAHDPPLLFMDRYLAPLKESPTKRFRPVSLGTMTLKKGRGTLTLKATEIPGERSIDFRLLMFDRVRKTIEEARP